MHAYNLHSTCHRVAVAQDVEKVTHLMDQQFDSQLLKSKCQTVCEWLKEH